MEIVIMTVVPTVAIAVVVSINIICDTLLKLQRNRQQPQTPKNRPGPEDLL